jgi:penicillin-binding protein-related factor A (putative recombinase)
MSIHATRKAKRSNDAGKSFQTRLESIFLGYRKAGRADIEKIDPPLKVYGTGAKRSVVFLENPWLDYSGVWTESGGRAIHIEAKSTEGERLALGGSGVSDNQIKALRRWTNFGAVAAVAWHHGNEIKIVPAKELLDAWDAGAKSMQWRHLPAVERGMGLVEFDILAALAARE